jgi:hypothetical protein
MRMDKENSPSKYAGTKIVLATTVLLAPLVVKSAVTIILKSWSKKKDFRFER